MSETPFYMPSGVRKHLSRALFTLLTPIYRQSDSIQGRTDKYHGFRTVLPAVVVGTVLSLAGCATPAAYKDIVSSYETMKVEVPASIHVAMRPIESLECAGGICTLTEADLLISEADKQALALVKQVIETENQSRARAYNLLIDALGHEDTARQKEAERADHLGKALDRERFGSALKTWLERSIFFLSAYVFSTL